MSARRKKKCQPYSEEDLLKGLTPHRAHADELAHVAGVETGEGDALLDLYQGHRLPFEPTARKVKD